MKRLIALVLCMLMVLTLVPIAAFAEKGEYYGPGTALPEGDYPKVSDKGVTLVAPREKDLVEEPYTKVVKSCGRLYLMPTPYSGNGTLGVVKDGEEVTILGKFGAMYYFQTEDGRYGWNGKCYFVNTNS